MPGIGTQAASQVANRCRMDLPLMLPNGVSPPLVAGETQPDKRSGPGGRRPTAPARRPGVAMQLRRTRSLQDVGGALSGGLYRPGFRPFPRPVSTLDNRAKPLNSVLARLPPSHPPGARA